MTDVTASTPILPEVSREPGKIRRGLAEAYHATNRAGRRALAFGHRHVGSFIRTLLWAVVGIASFWIMNAVYTWLLTISTGLATAYAVYCGLSMFFTAVILLRSAFTRPIS